MITNRSNSGFTLLEVMVALSIIAVALVTLLGTHLMSLDLARKHKDQTLTTVLAREKMEETMTVPFDTLASDSGDFGPIHPECTWELEVEEADIENLKKIKIIVKRPDGEFELETMIARTSAK
ncbi:MAG: type II secretion system minor pseudopilin GspI [Candidatus Lindowbacteria bacterium]|nr:type II secretion system minor pseudopilin GspI [Candidatus Lindowbacteria bacterium]